MIIERKSFFADPMQRAILEAAENGDLEKVKSYHELDRTLVECVDKDGYTPLHRACYGNHTKVVEVIN